MFGLASGVRWFRLLKVPELPVFAFGNLGTYRQALAVDIDAVRL